nr:hypothetical protein [Tanacetum cinerariifolium]
VAAVTTDIDLRHVGAGALAGVGDIERDGERLAAGDGEVGISEAGVAQPMAEGEQRLLRLALIPAIADVGALDIVDREARQIDTDAGAGIGRG